MPLLASSLCRRLGRRPTPQESVPVVRWPALGTMISRKTSAGVHARPCWCKQRAAGPRQGPQTVRVVGAPLVRPQAAASSPGAGRHPPACMLECTPADQSLKRRQPSHTSASTMPAPILPDTRSELPATAAPLATAVYCSRLPFTMALYEHLLADAVSAPGRYISYYAEGGAGDRPAKEPAPAVPSGLRQLGSLRPPARTLTSMLSVTCGCRRRAAANFGRCGTPAPEATPARMCPAAGGWRRL